jgi:hypothetical protein
MKTKIANHQRNKRMGTLLLSSILSLSLFGCGGSDGDDNGYIQLYNLSSNAPGVYLTVDQYDDDDYDENIHSPVSFTSISSRLGYDNDTYDIELAWEDDYDSVYDLEVVYESELKVDNDTVDLLVITDDIRSPTVLMYEIPVRDDDELDDDTDDEVFNLRVLNMHSASDGVDLYYSESDETFNEAILFNQSTYSQLSDNQKLDQDGYTFYLTNAGSTEVLYTSQDIDFPYASEHIIVVRQNTGVGTSPFTLDIISTSYITEYPDTNADAAYRVYNAMVTNDVFPEYDGSFDFYIDAIDDSPEVSNLAFGESSESIIIGSGDYSMNLVNPVTQETILSNHLLTLNENTDKTVFFYLLEEAVDDDNDGNIDENNDGQIDELEVIMNTLVVENNHSDSIYSHQMNVINLIDQDEIIDDFTSIKVYFILDDETVDTAEQSVTSIFATPSSVELLNNTYKVKVIGRLDSSNRELATTDLVLTEESTDQFIILEKDANEPSGYRMTFEDQVIDQQ